MTKKEIEVELRGEVLFKERRPIKRKLEKIGNFISHDKRLSVMYFGNIDNKNVDIRVRITNKKPEVVMKYGKLGACDRVEISQKISRSQFIGFAEMFFKFNFKSIIAEREIFNYSLPGGIIASLVLAGNISYIEIEKMSSIEEKDKNLAEVKKMAGRLKIRLFKNNQEFNNLCSRLNKCMDRRLTKDSDIKKLKELLKNY